MEGFSSFYNDVTLLNSWGICESFCSVTSLRIVDARDCDERLVFQARNWYNLQRIRYNFVHQSFQMFRLPCLVIVLIIFGWRYQMLNYTGCPFLPGRRRPLVYMIALIEVYFFHAHGFC